MFLSVEGVRRSIFINRLFYNSLKVFLPSSIRPVQNVGLKLFRVLWFEGISRGRALVVED